MGSTMNERLRELAVQSGIYNLNLVDETEYWILEKFAELIVRECAYIDFYKRAGISLKDNYRVTKVITEHFGIEQ
jgi:hypothetical protein